MPTIQDTNFVRLTGTLYSNPQVGLWKDVLMTKFFLLVRNDIKNRRDIIEITCFGKWANFTGRVLRNGDGVKIAGRFKTLPYRTTQSAIQHNTFIIAAMVEVLNLSWATISYRKKQWHAVDVIETQKACYTALDLGIARIPKTIRHLFFFSKSLQAEIYWRYCCFIEKRKRRKSKPNNPPLVRTLFDEKGSDERRDMPQGRWHTAEKSALKPDKKTEPRKAHGSGQALPKHTLSAECKLLSRVQAALHNVHYTKTRVLGKLKTTMNINKVQINETIDRDDSGNVIKTGMMINIRANNVDEAAQLYQELKAALNGKADEKAHNTPNGKANNTPTCECGSPMTLRTGSKGQFYGCCSYPKCRNTKEVQEKPRS